MQKKNVILDLDQTLINSEPLENFPFKDKGIKEKVLHFDIYNMDDIYLTAARPYLEEFLDELFKNYNVSIWTAASNSYMCFIIEHILLKNTNRKLDYVFFDYHCDLSQREYDYSKKLDLLFDILNITNYDSTNTIIIDDLKEVFQCQPDNAINIKPFNILDKNSENDCELKYIFNKIESKFMLLSKPNSIGN